METLEQQPNSFEEYDEQIKAQLAERIIEKALWIEVKVKDFYIPHKAVLMEDSETTKLQMVSDSWSLQLQARRWRNVWKQPHFFKIFCGTCWPGNGFHQ